MINAINTAVSGLVSASNKTNESAQRIAAAPADPSVDPLEDILDVKVSAQEFKANALVIKAASETTDELFRILDETV